MAVPLREALLRLCAEIGWTYAVFWRAIGFRNPTHLVWEDGHCKPSLVISGFDAMDLRIKEKSMARCSGNSRNVDVGSDVEDGVVGMLVRKIMVSQVHVIGNGVVGQAASTGNHRWIIHDDALDCIPSKDLTEMNIQFSAGIKTIAIIPVLPHGVVQLGSTEMVIENAGLINLVKCIFSDLGCTGILLSNFPCNTSDRGVPLLKLPLSQLPDQQLDDYCTISVTSVAEGSSHLLHGDQVAFVTDVTGESAHQFSPDTSALPSATLGFVPIVMNQSETFQPNHFVADSVQCDCKRDSGSLGGQISFTGATFDKRTVCRDSRSPCGPPPTVVTFGQCSGSSLIQRELLPYMSSIDSRGNNLNLDSNQSLPMGTVIKSSFANSSNVTLQSKSKYNKCTEGSHVISEGSACIDPCVGRSSHDIEAGRLNKQGCIFARDVNALLLGFGENSCCYDSLLESLPGCEISVSGKEKDSHGTLNLGAQARPSMLDKLTTSNSQFFARDYNASTSETVADISTCITDGGGDPLFDTLNYGDSYIDIFALDSHDQLLDSVISKVKSSVMQVLDDDDASCKNAVMKNRSPSLCSGPLTSGLFGSSVQLENKSLGLLPKLIENKAAVSDTVRLTASVQTDCSLKYRGYKPQMFPWAANEEGIKCDTSSAVHCSKVVDVGKTNRKRARPGESPRPRPKDRQMIQDRVKELREIVPNAAKCSIDALLEKTIKHMLFLQSVTKHADKLKEAGEPKIIWKEGGLALKDNFEGGATWAFEVGSQSLICPIIVEDLNPPRQMLVEMLCKERGFFLEIADLIRGRLGLTILKGVMEARGDKIWAKFAVEANRDVTRMEIFLSLMRSLEPAAVATGFDTTSAIMPPGVGAPPCSIPATGVGVPLG